MSWRDDIEYESAMREQRYRERRREREMSAAGWVVLAAIAAYVVIRAIIS